MMQPYPKLGSRQHPYGMRRVSGSASVVCTRMNLHHRTPLAGLGARALLRARPPARTPSARCSAPRAREEAIDGGEGIF